MGGITTVLSGILLILMLTKTTSGELCLYISIFLITNACWPCQMQLYGGYILQVPLESTGCWDLIVVRVFIYCPVDQQPGELCDPSDTGVAGNAVLASAQPRIASWWDWILIISVQKISQIVLPEICLVPWMRFQLHFWMQNSGKGRDMGMERRKKKAGRRKKKTLCLLFLYVEPGNRRQGFLYSCSLEQTEHF